MTFSLPSRDRITDYPDCIRRFTRPAQLRFPTALPCTGQSHKDKAVCTYPRGFNSTRYSGGASSSPTGKLVAFHAFGASVDADSRTYLCKCGFHIRPQQGHIFCYGVPLAPSTTSWSPSLPEGGHRTAASAPCTSAFWVGRFWRFPSPHRSARKQKQAKEKNRQFQGTVGFLQAQKRNCGAQQNLRRAYLTGVAVAFARGGRYPRLPVLQADAVRAASVSGGIDGFISFYIRTWGRRRSRSARCRTAGSGRSFCSSHIPGRRR